MRPCTIVGNVGADPEMRYTPKGVAVTDFSLALYGGKSAEGVEQTTWVRVTCWKELAEVVAKKVGKGDRVQVEGYLNPVELYQTKGGATEGGLSVTGWSVKALEYGAVDLVVYGPDAAGEVVGVGGGVAVAAKKGKSK